MYSEISQWCAFLRIFFFFFFFFLFFLLLIFFFFLNLLCSVFSGLFILKNIMSQLWKTFLFLLPLLLKFFIWVGWWTSWIEPLIFSSSFHLFLLFLVSGTFLQVYLWILCWLFSFAFVVLNSRAFFLMLLLF